MSEIIGPKSIDMPSPNDTDLESPDFNAIWSVIKSWDVNVPEYYEGYCGANGSHVMLIINKLRELNETKKRCGDSDRHI